MSWPFGGTKLLDGDLNLFNINFLFNINMIYFIKNEYPKDLDNAEFETIMRKYAIKQHSSLDFTFNAINIGTDKIFHGLETKKDLKFTRIKTSFEMFLPKLIISLKKDTNEKEYRIRLSAVPTAILGLLAFGLLIGTISLLQGNTTMDKLSPFLIIILFYSMLIFLEYKITIGRITKALNKSVGITL